MKEPAPFHKRYSKVASLLSGIGIVLLVISVPTTLYFSYQDASKKSDMDERSRAVDSAQKEDLLGLKKELRDSLKKLQRKEQKFLSYRDSLRKEFLRRTKDREEPKEEGQKEENPSSQDNRTEVRKWERKMEAMEKAYQKKVRSLQARLDTMSNAEEQRVRVLKERIDSLRSSYKDREEKDVTDLDRERKDPASYLSVKGKANDRFWGGWKLWGSIHSSAEIVTYKDPLLEIRFLDEKDSAIEVQERRLSHYIHPRDSMRFDVRMEGPKNADSVGLKVILATAVD